MVATPIGNIRDITLRAIDEIKKADVIFCEDTRQCQKLLAALGLELKSDCRLISCHSEKEQSRIDVAIERLLAGDSVLFMSDAGCPVISDPGSLLVQGVVAQGFSVEIIPGPSAITSALMGAGIDTTRFAFLGFLPQKKLARKKMIIAAASANLAVVIFESPLRTADLLTELFEILGPRRVVVARELTKLFETFHRGTLGSVMNPPLVDKGECVVVVEAGDVPNVSESIDVAQAMDDLIKASLHQGTSAKDVAKLVAIRFSIKKKQAYDLVLRHL